MTRIIRIALTETVNAYPHMPDRVEDLGGLRDRLDDIRKANVDHHVALMKKAADDGVRLICFGELFTGPYFALTRDDMWRGLAESASSGPTITRLKVEAQKHNLIVVAPIYEVDDDTGVLFNAAVVIDEAGRVIGKYRKCHIPEGENDQNSFTERFYYEASDGNNGSWPANISTNPFFPVLETSICNLGIAICYDRHFSGVMSTLKSSGAELVVSPAVTFGSKSERLWDMEFEVDAVRESLFIAGNNRRGSEKPWNQPYFGKSYATGPNGRCAAIDVGDSDLYVTDIDLDELHQVDPSGWDLRRDRRPTIYT